MLLSKSWLSLACIAAVSLVVRCQKSDGCSSALSMRPSSTYGAQPQDIGDNPPPFKLEVLDKNNFAVSAYKPGENYTIKLSSPEFFRGFIMQPRLAVGAGQTVGHFRIGEFVKDESEWGRFGIQYQECNGFDLKNSITQFTLEKKYSIEARWRALRNEGPVQFVATIIVNDTFFWYFWKPATGFVRPVPLTSSAEKTKAASHEQEQKPKQESQLPVGWQKVDLTTTPEPEPAANQSSAVSKPEPEPANQNQTNSSAEKMLEASHEKNDTTKPLPPVEHTTSASSSAEQNIFFEGNSPSVASKNESSPANPFSGGRIVGVNPIFVGMTHLEPDLPDEAIDYCASHPCYNQGSCKSKADGFECICSPQWSGKQCLDQNYCISQPCKNGGACTTSVFGAKCQCPRGWSGDRCHISCPAYLCLNGGTCTATDSSAGANNYGCICAAGFTGRLCETDINECESSPCFHNGQCKDKVNGFQCTCPEGYTGNQCQRPCVDVYHSCQQWNEEDRCYSSRGVTDFFDANCPVTCEQCIYNNETALVEVPPLPPMLEPFRFLLGKWVLNSARHEHYPIWFRNNETYNEVLEISQTEVPMFGIPSLNMTMNAKSNSLLGNTQTMNGFMTMSPVGRPIRVMVQSVNNNGFNMIEEGQLFPEQREMTLKMKFRSLMPQLKPTFPKSLKRSFSLWGAYLRITVDEEKQSGEKITYTNYYWNRQYAAAKA